MTKKKPISNRRAKKAATRPADTTADSPEIVEAPAAAAPPVAKVAKPRATRARTPRAKAAAAPGGEAPRSRGRASAASVAAAAASVAAAAAAAPPEVKVERTEAGVVILMAPAAPPPFPVDLVEPRAGGGTTRAPAVEAAPRRPGGGGAGDARRRNEAAAEDEVRARAIDRAELVADEADQATPLAEVPGTVDRVVNEVAPFAENGHPSAPAAQQADVNRGAPGRPAPGRGQRGPGPQHRDAPRGPETDAEREQRLSPSQKRRLRRKRRAQERDAEGGRAAGRPVAPPPPAVAAPPRPAPPVARAAAPPPPPAVRTAAQPPPPQRRPDPAPPARRNEPLTADDIEDEREEPLVEPVIDHEFDEPSLEERFERDTDLPGEEDDGDEEPAAESATTTEAPPSALRDDRGPREGRGERGGRRRRGRRGRGGRRRDGTWEPRPDEATEDGALPAGRDVRLDAIDVDDEPEDAVEVVGADDARDDAEAAVEKRREMIINIVPHEECRIAILADGKLEEIYLERASAENHVGNIYKGVVTNVEPSIQAAFVDFGLGKNGFLHISDLNPQYFRDAGAQSESVGRKMPRRRRPPIQRCLRRGQNVLVQITKEGIGTKGPTLTTYLSIPGRFLVMMPGMRELGVSRKIEDEDQRRKLRAQLDELELPDDMGFIARTAAQDRNKRELQSDLNYLVRLWRAVERRIREEGAPAELYRETDLVIRTIRDVFASDVGRVLVDSHEVAERAREFLSVFSPRSRDTVVEYDGPEPIFHKFGIEAELERLHSRHVPLRSGGSLVIDQTEALVAIDVNSGRFRTEDDAETTAYMINIEAADEIPRQLRLRDLGGVVICDFIDMREERHRREIERKLIRNLKQHKERAKVLRMSSFGIIEMTRQRQRASLTRSVYQDCFHCRGTGLVKTVESVALDVMRLVQLAVTKEHIRVIEVKVSAEVADVLLNRKRNALNDFEARHQRTITIRPDVTYGLDQVQIQCFDLRGRLVPQG